MEVFVGDDKIRDKNVLAEMSFWLFGKDKKSSNMPAGGLGSL